MKEEGVWCFESPNRKKESNRTMREGDETRKRKRIEKEERSTEEGGGGM
jgi:hypothetical protein